MQKERKGWALKSEYIYNNISNDPRKKQERNSTDEKNEEMTEWNRLGGDMIRT